MATVNQTFQAAFGVMGASAYPELKKFLGTNFPILGIAFDATADEGLFFPFMALGYGSGNLTLDLYWYADTASSGNVVWEGAIAAITPDSDTQDVETKAFATANTVTDSHLGTTGQRLHVATITISNLDSIAAGDVVTLRIRRLGSNGSDTMAGDAILWLLNLSYSDT